MIGREGKDRLVGEVRGYAVQGEMEKAGEKAVSTSLEIGLEGGVENISLEPRRRVPLLKGDPREVLPHLNAMPA